MRENSSHYRGIQCNRNTSKHKQSLCSWIWERIHHITVVFRAITIRQSINKVVVVGYEREFITLPWYSVQSQYVKHKQSHCIWIWEWIHLITVVFTAITIRQGINKITIWKRENSSHYRGLQCNHNTSKHKNVSCIWERIYLITVIFSAIAIRQTINKVTVVGYEREFITLP